MATLNRLINSIFLIKLVNPTSQIDEYGPLDMCFMIIVMNDMVANGIYDY